jgi:hypothetical protein
MHRIPIAWLLCVGTFILIGCSRECPTEPIKSKQMLPGDWDFSFSASNPSPCPNAPVTERCSGAGVLKFVLSGDSLEGSSSYRFSCQTCEWAGDFGDSGPLEDFKVSDCNLTFSIAVCRFRASLPEQEQDQIIGVVSCSLGTDINVNGTWRMTKTR